VTKGKKLLVWFLLPSMFLFLLAASQLAEGSIAWRSTSRQVLRRKIEAQKELPAVRLFPKENDGRLGREGGSVVRQSALRGFSGKAVTFEIVCATVMI